MNCRGVISTFARGGRGATRVGCRIFLSERQGRGRSRPADDKNCNYNTIFSVFALCYRRRRRIFECVTRFLVFALYYRRRRENSEIATIVCSVFHYITAGGEKILKLQFLF